MSDDRCQFCHCRVINAFVVEGGPACSDCISKHMERIQLPDTGTIIATLTRERDEARRERDEWAVMARGISKARATELLGYEEIRSERDQLKARAEKAEEALAALHAKWPFLAVDLPEASEETSAEVDALVRSIYASRPKRVIRPARAKPYEEKQP